MKKKNEICQFTIIHIKHCSNTRREGDNRNYSIHQRNNIPSSSIRDCSLSRCVETKHLVVSFTASKSISEEQLERHHLESDRQCSCITWSSLDPSANTTLRKASPLKDDWMTGWTVDFKPSSKRAKALLQYTKTRGRDDYDDMKKLDMQMTAANISKALTALHETPKGTALHETQKGTALHDTEGNGLARHRRERPCTRHRRERLCTRHRRGLLSF